MTGEGNVKISAEVAGTPVSALLSKVTALNGHKGLYSTVHYGRDEFWKLYNGEAYEPVKSAYDPAGRLPDLFAKCTAGK